MRCSPRRVQASGWRGGCSRQRRAAVHADPPQPADDPGGRYCLRGGISKDVFLAIRAALMMQKKQSSPVPRRRRRGPSRRRSPGGVVVSRGPRGRVCRVSATPSRSPSTRVTESSYPPTNPCKSSLDTCS
ncbi:hypothetical protein QJS66_18160 [Kocuria rhizophila]|nr:hypothetical protein QJS66_18160 [Kocuria rhizophila]